jgi:hypothetical protein
MGVSFGLLVRTLFDPKDSLSPDFFRLAGHKETQLNEIKKIFLNEQ